MRTWQILEMRSVVGIIRLLSTVLNVRDTCALLTRSSPNVFNSRYLNCPRALREGETLRISTVLLLLMFFIYIDQQQ
jgi:hypothetical protein